MAWANYFVGGQLAQCISSTPAVSSAEVVLYKGGLRFCRITAWLNISRKFPISRYVHQGKRIHSKRVVALFKIELHVITVGVS